MVGRSFVSAGARARWRGAAAESSGALEQTFLLLLLLAWRLAVVSRDRAFQSLSEVVPEHDRRQQRAAAVQHRVGLPSSRRPLQAVGGGVLRGGGGG